MVVATALLIAVVWFFSRGSSTTAMPVSMPVGDLPGWKQTGAQDFTTPARMGQVGEVYGPDMRGYHDLEDTSGEGRYTPDSVLSVKSGKLDYYLHSKNGTPRVASVVPFGYAGQTYGRYSIRFRSDKLPGYKIAFMLWPSSDDWIEGEIDWPEGELIGKMYGVSAIKDSTLKGPARFDPSTRYYSRTDATDWHVATTEWTPGKVKWFWDGELVGETSISEGVPNTNMRVTLQAETKDGADSFSPDTETSGHLEIDWVVQYAYAP
ncbi:glycoside hydrolase family 16 protein [Arthrobacter sp. PsM3]|uniref:glycoside hydrolase family 16 protein n=1 Tax=Arthrobacter sp. PsM3 TaxID=3030531 RepID=UPI00263A903A|nr:glycoside hydrolase family 16 protein [Arthrobacter sp. PsM3]MDN4643034.1 glycoside hydrolase family 16 protein [Arthrobacter sp. PsM3]